MEWLWLSVIPPVKDRRRGIPGLNWCSSKKTVAMELERKKKLWLGPSFPIRRMRSAKSLQAFKFGLAGGSGKVF